MKTALKIFGVAAMSALSLAGCANNAYNGNTYSGSEAMSGQSVSYGTITSIRAVQIQDDTSGFGGLGGGVLGGFLGNALGGGSGRSILTAAGAVGGAVAGNSIERSAQNTNAMEVQVERDDGKNVVVVQAADNSFSKGQRVRLVGSGSKLRVVHY
ncbi:glycine zipper 2TM domain-containing protein [Carnimonas nigrificans]|uniref:glycine zipper 2TM domain-containing protein n=1 Tax=Carnimonas nigrificans TaxID=64323 RepID=UPI00046F3749|nr:glycine zipper 2TM domain-containing protein [Carnimonas nigrificans]